ncbi:succinyl-CoA synthetase-like protein [Mycena filopes]|nr:succinyl-CoA synthetase-like protein [Mycena filopes]
MRSSMLCGEWRKEGTRHPPALASFCTTSSRHSYKDTLKNLKIGPETRVIFQGFTGRLATANAQESLAWGTQIVGGVTPGREGTHPLIPQLPVLPTVRAAMEILRPDATGIYVAASQAAAAIEEAIEAEVPLIVAVAEHIPVHDMLNIHSMLKSQSKSRLVGANAPGIISALGRCRIGFQPLPVFSPGHIGIVAKSGTLSYETVASLTRAGLGQSLCIGMGGDIVAGTDFVDALTAAWIDAYRKRTPDSKPIAALVAGKLIRRGYVMGHSGAWVGRGENSAQQKHDILERAGAVMVDHPSQFGDEAQPSLISAAHVFLRQQGVNLVFSPPPDSRLTHLITLSIDRSTRNPLLPNPRNLLLALFALFKRYEAVVLEVEVQQVPVLNTLHVLNPRFIFDKAAWKSCRRHPEVVAARKTPFTAALAAAEEDGIVYVRLGPKPGDAEFGSYNIGTLVNGAGLAMNTVDALPPPGRAANFLDTGGKATADTVRRAFALLLANERVKVIFVNVFGGLTRGEMIADGIVLAVRELGVKERGIPVVVRIRGTGEEEGRRILEESGLEIFAFDEFEAAAAKSVELAEHGLKVRE